MSMKVTNPLDILRNFLDLLEQGRVFLSYGQYEYKFVTKSKPTTIWIAESTVGNLPVCHGDVNEFGVRLLDDGFVLIADVKSDTTEVLWQAFFDEGQ
jgi:hypothetical protein